MSLLAWFRIYVRALLSVMDYGSIRTFIMGVLPAHGRRDADARVSDALLLAADAVTAGILFVNPLSQRAVSIQRLLLHCVYRMLFVPRWLKRRRPRRWVS
jgi:hypothetical protein